VEGERQATPAEPLRSEPVKDCVPREPEKLYSTEALGRSRISRRSRAPKKLAGLK